MKGGPSCIKLVKKQQSAYDKWVTNVLQPEAKRIDYEGEDVCCSSPITFKVYATGIGDSIVAECFGFKLDLSLDDDGELS